MNQREPARLRLHTNSRSANAAVFVGVAASAPSKNAFQTGSKLHWATLLLLGCILCQSIGCSVWRETNRVYDLARRTTQIEPHYYDYIRSDKVAQREARLLAKQAWAENPMNEAASADFKNGFHEGFADYLYRGGSGEPPVIPPRGYWNLRFLNQFGKVSINDWNSGFRAGAADCKARGLRDMWLVPTSLVVDESADNLMSGENEDWSGDETWNEETYRRRVEERQREKARLEALREAEEPPIPDGEQAADSDDQSTSEDDAESESEDDSAETGNAVDILGGGSPTEDDPSDPGTDLGPALDMVPDVDGSELDANDDRGAFDIQPGEDSSSTEESTNSDLLMDDLFESTATDTGASTQTPETDVPGTQVPDAGDTSPLELPDEGGANDTIDFDAFQSRSPQRNTTTTQLAFRTNKRPTRTRTQQTRRDTYVRQASGITSNSSTARNPVRKASDHVRKQATASVGKKTAKTKDTQARSKSNRSTSPDRGRPKRRSTTAAKRSSGDATLLFFEEKQDTQTLDFTEPLPSLPLQLESTDVIYWDPVSGEHQSSSTQLQMQQQRTNAAQLRARQQQTEQAQAKVSILKSSRVVERSTSSDGNRRKEIDPADLVFDSGDPPARTQTGFDARPLPPRTKGGQHRPSKFAGWDPMEGVEENGFADLDRSKFTSVLSNEVLEKATRWTPEMARSAQLPERVAEMGTRMIPKRSKLQSVDRPPFESTGANQDEGLRKQLSVALRDKSIQYRRSTNSTTPTLSSVAPVVDAARQSPQGNSRTGPRFFRADEQDLPMVIDRESLPRSVNQGTGAVQLRLRD